MMRTKLGLTHPLALGLSHCICGQPLNPTRRRTPPLLHSWQGEEVSHDINGICTLANIIIINCTQVDLASCVALSRKVVMMVAAWTKEGLIKISTLQTCFSLLPLKSLNVYINKLTIFSIVVLTWLG